MSSLAAIHPFSSPEAAILLVSTKNNEVVILGADRKNRGLWGRECDSSEEMEVLGQVRPYADEPPAHTSDEEEDAEDDQDSLSPAVLRSRLEREVPLNEWCKCEECKVENLTDAVEYRCCREIAQARQKLMFDGSIERISCITKHDDYSAMTNRSVLSQAAPLLRDRNGRGYRRRDGQTQNQFLRAVAYRWLVRWICGHLGWDNTRPLPACVYDDIRQKLVCPSTWIPVCRTA